MSDWFASASIMWCRILSTIATDIPEQGVIFQTSQHNQTFRQSHKKKTEKNLCILQLVKGTHICWK